MDTNRQLRRLLGGMLLAATTSLFAQISSSKTVRHHRVVEQDPSQPPELSQAEAAIEKKDYASAEPLLKKVASAQPSNYQAWFDLGFVYNALGRTEESVSAYRQSVTAKPDVFESNLNLGLSLAKNNQPGAEEFLRAATKLKPQGHPEEGHARAWLGLGHVLEESDPDAAIEAFQQAAALQPKDPEPRLSAGFLLEKANKFADAEEQYKQALTLDPSSQDALVGLANVYMRGKRYPEAEDYLRKVVAQRPTEAQPHIQLGRVLAADQKYDDAAMELQAGLKIAPNDAGAQNDLADVYLETGKFAEAEAVYRSLLTTHAEDRRTPPKARPIVDEAEEISSGCAGICDGCKAQAELGSRLRRSCLCRQRDPGLCARHQGARYARPVSTGNSGRILSCAPPLTIISATTIRRRRITISSFK